MIYQHCYCTYNICAHVLKLCLSLRQCNLHIQCSHLLVNRNSPSHTYAEHTGVIEALVSVERANS